MHPCGGSNICQKNGKMRLVSYTIPRDNLPMPKRAVGEKINRTQPASDKSRRRREAKPTRSLLDITVCRAKPSGFGDFFYCLVVAPYDCTFALNFGGVFLCLNPEREAIAARTTTAQP